MADMTTDEERGRGMAWLGTATSLGFVVGPALGGTLSWTDLHFTARYGHVMFDSFSVPLFATFAQAKFNYVPGKVGAVSMVCGLVMTMFRVPRSVSWRDASGRCTRSARGLA